MPGGPKLDRVNLLRGSGALLLILAFLSTFEARRGQAVFEAFSDRGIGAGTPFYTTWNVLFALAGIACLVAAWILKRRAGRA